MLVWRESIIGEGPKIGEGKNWKQFGPTTGSFAILSEALLYATSSP